MAVRISEIPWSRGRLVHVIDAYERQLIRKGRSPNTLRAYRWALDDLIRFAGQRGITEVGDFDRKLLEDWQDAMLARGVNARSRGLAATAARQLIRFAAGEDLVDARLERALPSVKAPRLTPRPIPPDDLLRLKAFLSSRRPRMNITDLRDRALFYYLLSTGARVSEALQVTRAEAREALVVQKGGSQKVLRIPPTTAQYVDDYLRVRTDNIEWLWVTHDTNRDMRRLDPAAVREVWRKLARRVGIKPFTTHQLRHTFATEALDAGIPEIVVAELLGHHGLGTIHVYAQVREAQRRQAMVAIEELVKPPTMGPRVLKPLRKRSRRSRRDASADA